MKSINKNRDKNSLTNYEVIATIVNAIITVGVLTLPVLTAKEAQQDAWVSVLLGGIYPMFIIFIGWFIVKRDNTKNIVQITTDLFGGFFGKLLALLFSIQFIYYTVMVLDIGQNLVSVFGASFMNKDKLVIIWLLVMLYVVSKGLKTLAKIDFLAFWDSFHDSAYFVDWIKRWKS